VSAASSIDGNRNGRPDLQARQDQRDRLGRLLRPDPDRPIGRQARQIVLDEGALGHAPQLAVACRLPVPDQRRRIGGPLGMGGEVRGE